MITIRPATTDDKANIIEALHQMLIQTEKDGFPSDILPIKENAEMLYANSVESAIENGDPVLVAEDEEKFCGMMAVAIRRDGYKLKQKCAFGCGLFIYPEYRGVGLTRKLMNLVDAMLHVAGVTIWEEAVFCGNLFPQAVLNAHGFTHSMRVYRKELK